MTVVSSPLVPQLPSPGVCSLRQTLLEVPEAETAKLVHTVRSTRISISHYFIHVYYLLYGSQVYPL